MWHSFPSAVFITIMTESRSPNSGPIVGSTSALPVAKTSAGSSSSMKRARSKSWIVMSRKMPPEAAI